MESGDKVRLAKAAVPILFATSGVSDPLQGGEERKGSERKVSYEDPEDDYLANALARNAASAAVSVGKAMYPTVKQAAVDMYPAVRDAVVESAKSAYTSTKLSMESEEERIPARLSVPQARSGSVEIAIGDAVIKEDRILSKHVVYTIRGRDSSGSFDAFRRYSDFVALRVSLIRKWPGLYVPAVPPKQYLGNTNQQFIDDRRVMLDDFLHRLVSVDVLEASEEFQMFIRGSNEFEKDCSTLAAPTYSQIARTYSAKFSKFANPHADPMPKLEEEEKFFMEASIKLKTIKDVSKHTKDTYGAFQVSFNSLSEQFQWVEEKYLSSCIGRDYRPVFRTAVRTEMVNPYGFLYDWLKCELLDCRATVEAIQKVRELDTIRTKFSTKLESDKQDLEKLQLGKTLLSHVLTFKSRGTSMSNLEKDIQHYTQEVEALTSIVRIVSCRLLEYELPRLKEAKEAVYTSFMRRFALSSQKEMDELGRAFKGGNRDRFEG